MSPGAAPCANSTRLFIQILENCQIRARTETMTERSAAREYERSSPPYRES